jgi:hypothetical protein
MDKPISTALFSRPIGLHRDKELSFQSSAGWEQRELSSFTDIFSPPSTPSPTLILLANSNAPEARWILAGGETTGDCDHENPEPRQGRQTRIPDPALLPERGIVN